VQIVLIELLDRSTGFKHEMIQFEMFVEGLAQNSDQRDHDGSTTAPQVRSRIHER
jgi:hypothetical protein